jgi:hypothetical protein
VFCKSDLEKTSLGRAVHFFQTSFLDPLLQASKVRTLWCNLLSKVQNCKQGESLTTLDYTTIYTLHKPVNVPLNLSWESAVSLYYCEQCRDCNFDPLVWLHFITFITWFAWQAEVAAAYQEKLHESASRPTLNWWMTSMCWWSLDFFLCCLQDTKIEELGIDEELKVCW